MAISMCFLLNSGVCMCVRLSAHLFFPVSLWARQELQTDMQGPAKDIYNILLKKTDFLVRSRAKAVMIQWFGGPVHFFLKRTQTSLTHTLQGCDLSAAILSL